MKLTNKILVPVITVLITGCGPSDSDFMEFSSYESPDGNYTVVVDYAHSSFAFGPETIRVFVTPKASKARNHIVTTKISNDGGITAENIKAEWVQSDIIKFCMTGVEQDDRVLEINLQTFSYSEVNDSCVK